VKRKEEEQQLQGTEERGESEKEAVFARRAI
jgi:hypothetical protein